MSRLGIVTGLTVEAAGIKAASHDLPRDERPRLGVAGGSAQRAAILSRQHLAAGVEGLVSFGMAGGLDESLRPGDIVVGTTVRGGTGDSLVETSAAWTRLIAEALAGTCRVHTGGIVGVDAPVATVAEKYALRSKTDALAVDMESHGIALAAAEADSPLLVIRAIADPVSRAIPAAALAGMGSGGRRRPLAVVGMLLRRPADIAAILRLSKDSAAALRSLSVAARILLRQGLR